VCCVDVCGLSARFWGDEADWRWDWGWVAQGLLCVVVRWFMQDGGGISITSVYSTRWYDRYAKED
jgi:hypothetical protein